MSDLLLSDYTYKLPADSIASYGLKKRDNSKLMHYEDGAINHQKFSQLPDLLPSDSTLFFNDTKVIQARLLLKRQTGALIEVFLLSPARALETIHETLKSTESAVYNCLIGNLKKWKPGEVLTQEIKLSTGLISLKAEIQNRESKSVKFSWNSSKTTFLEIINAIGHTPLPPYINRPDEDGDKQRYQTVYSKKPGAVAAPTAGLHFTNEVLENIRNKGIKTDYLTLHVSAGTFQPIKETVITNHDMHSERIILSRNNIEHVISARNLIAVGTTSLRTLESAYWFGVQLLTTTNDTFKINKLAPYSAPNQLPSRTEAFLAILDYMNNKKTAEISGETEIFIFPGYKFKVCDALITNFHQPGSTLILLVAAFIGNDWKAVYHEALNHDYRFLSFGDSSYLVPSE